MALTVSECKHAEVILLSGGRSKREVAEKFNTAPNYHTCVRKFVAQFKETRFVSDKWRSGPSDACLIV
jgi:hypothetical protein